jgi:hypothetical protein
VLAALGTQGQNSIKIQQILTTAEHYGAESLILYLAGNLDLWVKTGQNSVSISNDHQESSDSNPSLLKLHSMMGMGDGKLLQLIHREQKHTDYETALKTICGLKMCVLKKIQ